MKAPLVSKKERVEPLESMNDPFIFHRVNQ